MKHIAIRILCCLAAWVAIPGLMHAQNIFYGYAPQNYTPDECTVQGTGKNNYFEVAICLDPSVDPAFARLQGKKIKGVRVYLTSKYHQKRKEFSAIRVYKNDFKSTPIETYVNFDKGWNEALFAEPITIEPNTKYYVSTVVFEVNNQPFPFVCNKNCLMPDAYYAKVDINPEWNDYHERGAVLMSAIIDAENKWVDNTASAYIQNPPTLVKPSAPFNADVYIKNYSNKAIKSIELNVNESGNKVSTTSYTLKNELAPFDGTLVSLPITTGAKEDNNLPYSLQITKINGVEAQPAILPSTPLFVTQDAFNRVVLIEEFTSQKCPSCPFMSYYLTKAKHAANKAYVFVTYHAGYQEDSFTKQIDRELLFLGVKGNPAVMYNRARLKGNLEVVVGAREASEAPYIKAINQAADMPAMAKVLVDVKKEGDAITCTVHGKISKFADDKTYYLSTYLIENKIPFSQYPQMGLDTEGAPSDIEQVIDGHNGIIREVLCTTAETGDPITTDGDRNFSVTYPTFNLNEDWEWDNCQIVAFVHEFNNKDVNENVVLNAGSNKLNDYVNDAPVIEKEKEALKVRINSDKSIEAINVSNNEIRIFDISGAAYTPAQPLLRGTYIVTTTNNKYAPIKVLIP